MSWQVRILTGTDAGPLFRMRYDSLRESPDSFRSSPEDDLMSSEEATRGQLERGDGSVVFGAFGDGLVGMLGLYRGQLRKDAHKVFLWGMYVTPPWRGQGIGGDLMICAIDHARALAGATAVYLSVSAAAPIAKRLYERFGFRVWGVEPDALRVDSQSLDEHHMILRLLASGRGS
jgi:RimJ/RimL family protein N-acetyltransferase